MKFGVLEERNRARVSRTNTTAVLANEKAAVRSAAVDVRHSLAATRGPKLDGRGRPTKLRLTQNRVARECQCAGGTSCCG